MRMGTSILIISLLLAVLISIVSFVGLFTPDFYSRETPNWQAQSVGQDIVDLLFISPALIISSIMAFRNNKIFKRIWGGVLLYLVYTFVLYCFDVHFNALFILYCFCLGLSFYLFVNFLYQENALENKEITEIRTIDWVAGIYFITLSALFYFLWLAEIIPSIVRKTTPKSVEDAGLFTNGVHVIDLSVILPGIFIAGVSLLQKKRIGFILAPVFLTFFILMDITIGTLTIIMKMRGLESNLMISFIMAALALFSLSLLLVLTRPALDQSR